MLKCRRKSWKREKTSVKNALSCVKKKRVYDLYEDKIINIITITLEKCVFSSGIRIIINRFVYKSVSYREIMHPKIIVILKEFGLHI